MSIDPFNLDLYYKIFNGDEQAAKMYCGSYTLVRTIPPAEFQMFRCRGDVPRNFMEVLVDDGEVPYDSDGFLKRKYWSLPRIGEV